MAEHILQVAEGRSAKEVIAALRQRGTSVRHRIGERLLVVDSDEVSEIPGARRLSEEEIQRIADKGSTFDGEGLLVAATQHRAGADFARRKRERPRAGQAWDAGAPPDAPDDGPEQTAGGRATDPSGGPTTTGQTTTATTEVPAARQARPSEQGPRPGTRATPVERAERLVNEVGVKLVVVQAPADSPYTMSFAEALNVAAEVQQGLDWLATVEPDANITWSYDGSTVTVDVEPWTGARWPGMPDAWYGGIRAAFTREDTNKIYLFRGSEYVRFSSVEAGIDPGYPNPIAGNWKGLPASFNAGIDAALWRDSNSSIYFFKGSQYVRIDPATNTMEAGYPKPIAGNWKNLPANFEAGIDAALMRKDNSRIYFFKGDEYVRINVDNATMDPGFPAKIKDNWHGLPSDFQEGVNAALWRLSNDKIYLFKDRNYVRITSVPDGVDEGYPLPIGLSRSEAEALWRDAAQAQLGYPAGMGGVEQMVADTREELGTDTAYAAFFTRWPVTWFAYAGFPRVVMHIDNDGWGPSNIDSVFAHETGHIFGAPDEYSSSGCDCDSVAGRFHERKNLNCQNCAGPTIACLMKSNTLSVCDHSRRHLGWAPMLDGIDAALWRDHNDKIYLFGGDSYVRITDVSAGRDDGYPAIINGNWKHLPAAFRTDIDAALQRKSNGKIYFFKGNQYVRIDGATATMDAGYPQSIAPNWKNLPASFQAGIDAALWRESNGKIYLFKGNQYVRVDDVTATMDAGYPKPIAGNWKNLPASFNAGIDAALMRMDNSKIYFFKGTQYARLDGETATMDAGYPNWIDGNWLPFPR